MESPRQLYASLRAGLRFLQGSAVRALSAGMIHCEDR